MKDASYDHARCVEDSSFAKNETASVNPHGYWELGILGDSRRPKYVQIEAIFRRGAKHRVLQGTNEPHRELMKFCERPQTYRLLRTCRTEL